MLKNILIFIAGFVTGIVFVIAVSMLFVGFNSADTGINIFDEEGECVSYNSFKVFQVLDSGNALAKELEPEYSMSTGLTVLFLKSSEASFYDDQIIKIPSGKCAKQIGTYKYSSNAGVEKTVPIVDIR